jgi:hypothetical protein
MESHMKNIPKLQYCIANISHLKGNFQLGKANNFGYLSKPYILCKVSIAVQRSCNTPNRMISNESNWGTADIHQRMTNKWNSFDVDCLHWWNSLIRILYTFMKNTSNNLMNRVRKLHHSHWESTHFCKWDTDSDHCTSNTQNPNLHRIDRHCQPCNTDWSTKGRLCHSMSTLNIQQCYIAGNLNSVMVCKNLTNIQSSLWRCKLYKIDEQFHMANKCPMTDNNPFCKLSIPMSYSKHSSYQSLSKVDIG